MSARAFAVIVLVSLAATAEAGGRRVLVFPLEGAQEIAKPLTPVVARAAGLAGADVTVSGATFDDTTALAGCTGRDAACLGQVAQALGVDEVVLGRVEQPGADGKVLLLLSRYQDGKVIEREFRLPPDQAVERTAREASGFFLGDGEPAPVPVPVPEPKPPAPVPVPTPPPVRDEPRRRIHPLSWVVVGTGALLVGGGFFFFSRAASKQDEVDSAPTSTQADFEHLLELEDDGARLTTIGNALLIGGGAVLLVGGGLVIYQGFLRSPTPVAVRVAPLPGGAVVRMEIRLP